VFVGENVADWFWHMYRIICQIHEDVVGFDEWDTKNKVEVSGFEYIKQGGD